MTLKYGGSFFEPFNIKNEDGLEFLLEAVKSSCFGIEMYPTIYDKAALYMYNINSDHIFHDGNKRTGLASSLLFLNKNGYELNNVLDDTLINITLEVADHKVSREDLTKWFELNTRII
jgi:death on curing protein